MEGNTLTFIIYILGTVLGSLVGIWSSVIIYRRTVGVYRTKVENANKELTKLLLRRIVNEKYQPELSDISRIIEAKCREFKIKSKDLYSEIEILNTIYTEVSETDFLTKRQRGPILGKLAQIFLESEEKIEERKEEIVRRFTLPRSAVVMFTGFFATLTVVIAILSISSTFVKGTPFAYILTSIFAIFITISALSIIIIIDRFQELKRKPSEERAMKYVRHFENNVGKILSEFGVVEHEKRLIGFVADFLLTLDNGKREVIETKYWKKAPSYGAVYNTTKTLRNLISRGKADEAIIVTPKRISIDHYIKKIPNIKVIPIGELQKYLTQVSKLKPKK